MPLSTVFIWLNKKTFFLVSLISIFYHEQRRLSLIQFIWTLKALGFYPNKRKSYKHIFMPELWRKIWKIFRLCLPFVFFFKMIIIGKKCATSTIENKVCNATMWFDFIIIQSTNDLNLLKWKLLFSNDERIYSFHCSIMFFVSMIFLQLDEALAFYFFFIEINITFKPTFFHIVE